jgi:hypothetical protein
MKIKNFIKYLENIREDDSSHLNDKLDANNKNERGEYDYDDDSTKNYDYGQYGEYDDFYDEEDEDYYAGRSDDDDDDYEEDDDVEHLSYLLRQMFKNSGIDDVRVTAKKNRDILIEVHMGKKETLRSIIKVFEVANKLKRDILAQYDAEFDIWKSKNGSILAFGFGLDEGLDDDNMPF